MRRTFTRLVPLLILTLLPAGAGGFNLPFKPQTMAENYSPLMGKYNNSKGWVENYRGCIARGGDPKTCYSLATFCFYKNAYFAKAYPGFVGGLQIFDAFAMDCGSGICFQCCYTGGGCHSSFHGWPVINCNKNYGAKSKRAGNTLIINPSTSMGKPCLYIPQTCEHIPICHYNGKKDIAALEKKLLNGANHPLNYPHAKKQRALTVANSIRKLCVKYIDEYSTDADKKNDYDDMITGRGCVGWRSNVTKKWPFDWTKGSFPVNDVKTKKYSPPASAFNAMVHLCTYRVLAALPNLRKRLDVTESRVWSTKAKAAYLAKVKDPDEEFKKHASHHALEILKKVSEIYDYKLLAVPVKGEPSLAGTFNGCKLGTPPKVKLAYVKDGNTGVKLTVFVQDPEYPTTKLDNPLYVVWGDGSVTRTMVPAGKSLTLSHTYTLGGRYLPFAIASNDSGLRGITAMAVQTAKSAGIKAPPTSVPTVSRVVFKSLDVTEASLSGNSFYNHFELHMQDEAAKEARIGLSKPGMTYLNKTTSHGNLAGRNTLAAQMKKLIIKPKFTGGFAIGLKHLYMTTSSLSLEVVSNDKDGYQTANVYLKPSDVKVYPKGQTTPIPASSLTYDAKGRLMIPLISKVKGSWTWAEKIEIELTATMFSSMLLGPTSLPLPEGKYWMWIEPRPNQLVVVPVCGNTTKEAPETCDDGDLVDGDGCSSTCTAETVMLGVKNLTAKRVSGGAVVSWETQQPSNCKTFTLLRCQGTACSTKAAHKPVTSIGTVACKYGAGVQTYSYIDPGASPYMPVSYYLLQTGVGVGATHHWGPALLAVPPPDLGPPDLVAPDTSVADQGVPDQAVTPDKTAPDQAAPDQAAPDQGVPDQAATPDKTAPDKAAVDRAVDQSQVAELQPTPGDLAAVDQQQAVTSPGGGGCSMSSGNGAAGTGLLWVLALLAVLRRWRAKR